MNNACASCLILFKQSSLLLISIVLFSTLSASGNVDSTWDALLKKYVSEGSINGIGLSVLNYEGLARDSKWRRLLGELASSSIPVDPDVKKAFWINAYNILAIKVVLSAYPVESIKDVGPIYKQVWNVQAGKVAGKMYTLNYIEHKLLRPMGDPLIHAAIVCASVSCPDLRTEVYLGSQINEQLADQMRRFLTNKKKGAFLSIGKLRVSAIFNFFTEDFVKASGSLKSFLTTYLTEDLSRRVTDSTQISFMDYDWSLNDRKRATK